MSWDILGNTSWKFLNSYLWARSSVSSVTQSCLSLWPHGLQHARLPGPSANLELAQTHLHQSVMPLNHLIHCKQWQFYFFPMWILFLFLLWLPWLGLPKLCWIILPRVTFYNEASPHISQNGCHWRNLYIINSGECVEKKGTFLHWW